MTVFDWANEENDRLLSVFLATARGKTAPDLFKVRHDRCKRYNTMMAKHCQAIDTLNRDQIEIVEPLYWLSPSQGLQPLPISAPLLIDEQSGIPNYLWTIPSKTSQSTASDHDTAGKRYQDQENVTRVDPHSVQTTPSRSSAGSQRARITRAEGSGLYSSYTCRNIPE